MTKKRKIILGSGLGVLLLGAAGIAVASGGDRGAMVRTEVVTRRDLVSTVTASGQIQPRRKVDISADISGRVIELAVEEGQWVERDALLLRIDPTSYAAHVRRAEASVAQARAQEAQARASLLQAESSARRAEGLARSNELVSGEELEQARTQVAVNQAQLEAARYRVAEAEAALSEAREALRKTTITAPMSGRVTRLNIEEGETAVVGTMNNPGSLLLTVADLGEMEARVKVDETEVPRISLGDSAIVRIDAFPGQRFGGEVVRISNSSIQNPAAGSQGSSGGQAVDFEVVVALTDPPAELRPDLSATAEIVTATRQNALSIPILSLTVRDGEGQAVGTGGEAAGSEVEGVFLVRDGRAEFVPVRVGIAGERHFEILEGLQGGEVVVSGTYQTIRDLRDGATVRLPEEAAPSGAATADTAVGR